MVKPFLYYLLFFCISIFHYSCSNETPDLLEIELNYNKLSWDEKLPCEIMVKQNGLTKKIKAKAKYRGGMSSKYNKHSFTLDLKEKVSFNNMPISDDWIINAGYIDKTFMRHKICFDLFRQMGPNNKASKVSYMSLKQNQNYQGLYLLMSKINASFLNINKTDSNAMIFKGPPFLYKDKLLEVQDSLNYYHQKYPKKKKINKTYVIEDFRSFLFNSNDSVFKENINYWVDLENVIDWHLLLLYSYNGDGILKNFYLYKLDKSTPFRFAIWDYDHSFGRDGDGELNMMERSPGFHKSVLFRRLMEIDDLDYKRRLKSRWSELRKTGLFSESKFANMINENEKLFKDELKKNFEKWPIDSKDYYDANTYEMEVNIMKEFVAKRIPHLDNYFKNME